MPPPDKPRHHSGYQREETALVKAACLTVAVTLGALMDRLCIVGGLAPSLLIDHQANADPTSEAGHAGTPDAQHNSRAPGTSTPQLQPTPTGTSTTSCAPAANADCRRSVSPASGQWPAVKGLPTSGQEVSALAASSPNARSANFAPLRVRGEVREPRDAISLESWNTLRRQNA